MSESAIQYPEINSLELLALLVHEKGLGEQFVDYDRVGTYPMVVRLKKDGRTFLVNDDLSNTNRNRSIEELLRLHTTCGLCETVMTCGSMVSPFDYAYDEYPKRYTYVCPRCMEECLEGKITKQQFLDMVGRGMGILP